MAENGNGKAKAGTVVSIITSIVMVLAVGGSLLFNVSNSNTKKQASQNTEINELCTRVGVLESKVESVERTQETLSTRMNNLRESNSMLQKKLGIITEILNRLDKRTKKLEDYIYSDRDKEKK